MKIILFVFVIIVGCISTYGSAIETQEQKTAGERVDVGYIEMSRQSAFSFKKDSPLVVEAYGFFSGQNIQNAHDEDYVKGFVEGRYPIEVMYALYRALGEFLVPGTGRFVPEDLNGGLTDHNYKFLKAVFEDSNRS